MASLPTKATKIGPGALSWIFINGDGALNDLKIPPAYEYKATIILPKEKAQPYIDELTAFWEEYAGQKPAKSLGFKDELDENKKPTGNVTFTFKTNTAFKQKDGTEKPAIVRVFRGNGQEITDSFHAADKKAGNGSEGVLHGVMAIYDRKTGSGVTLYLSAVQFTKFKPYMGAVDVTPVSDADDGLDGADGLDVAPVAPDMPATTVDEDEIPI